MEIDKKDLLLLMCSASILKSQAEDVVENNKCGDYEEVEDLENDLKNLEKRCEHIDRILKEIDDKYFK